MRIIGIRHRVKKTVEGESRPTQVAILENGKLKTLELETETDELDFVLGRFPTSFRNVEVADMLAGHTFPSHQIKWRLLKKEEDHEMFPVQLLKKEGSSWYLATKLPASFDGLKEGDKVAMMLGGSGDNMAFALARRGQDIGGSVFRIPPFVLGPLRTNTKKDSDAELLCKTLETMPHLFYQVGPRDLSLIWLRECLRSRVDAMKARIACEQRLRQRTIGSVFCAPNGLFPEGDIEKQFDEVKANDKIYQALLSEEGKRERDLEKACRELDVYTELFEPIKGAGPKIASRIIAATINIHRFETKAKFRAFCGVHLRVHWVCSDCGKKSSIESWGSNLPEIPQCIHCGSVNVAEKGIFPRRRNNEVANWSGDCRQALFLLADQFNRRPESEWGQKLLAAKAKYRASHPEVLEVDGKKRYTDGHIHKMAIWYTLGKFAEQLFKNWHNLEKKIQNSNQAKAA